MSESKNAISSEKIKKLVKHIKSNPKIILFVGAGASTAAGIPDFRSPSTGLYHNLQSLNLPYAEAVFDLPFFKSNPKPFYTLAKELYPGQFLPTKFHFFIRLLQEKNLLHRVYTQNIDTLERVAGVRDEYIVEAHGSFAANHCIKCGASFPNEKFKEIIFKKEIPRCQTCHGLVKPDIVFFGEGLPDKFFNQWEEDLSSLQDATKENEFLTITCGTSLTVFPFASLPAEVPESQSRVLINNELVGCFKMTRTGDTVILEKCDEIVLNLVEELGWKADLENLINDVLQSIQKSKLQKETGEKVKCAADDAKVNLETNKKSEDALELAKDDEDEETKKLRQDMQNLGLAGSKNTTSKSI